MEMWISLIISLTVVVIGWLWFLGRLPDFQGHKPITEEQFEELRDIRKWHPELHAAVHAAMQHDGPIKRRQYRDIIQQYKYLVLHDLKIFEETGEKTQLLEHNIALGAELFEKREEPKQ